MHLMWICSCNTSSNLSKTRGLLTGNIFGFSFVKPEKQDKENFI